jgi:hypothetical protein
VAEDRPKVATSVDGSAAGEFLVVDDPLCDGSLTPEARATLLDWYERAGRPGASVGVLELRWRDNVLEVVPRPRVDFCAPLREPPEEGGAA